MPSVLVKSTNTSEGGCCVCRGSEREEHRREEKDRMDKS